MKKESNNFDFYDENSMKSKTSTVGFYAGSFDPFTNGHLGIVKQAAKIFDKVIIGMGVNPAKKRRFDKDKMKLAIEAILIRENLKNVCVVIYEGLSVDIAHAYHTTYLIRGIRNEIDYQYEENLASINEELSGIETMYFRAGKMGNISSSMVMELFKYGRDISCYLPTEIAREVYSIE